MTQLSDLQAMKFRFNDTESQKLQKLEQLRLAAVASLEAINEAIWGLITGTLADQTDLQAALDLKLNGAAVSAFGLTLIDDASATVARGTLGLGNVDNTADSAKNVLTATKLVTARSITVSGDMAWTVSFDGSAAVSAGGTLATVNSNTGTYGGLTTSPQISVDGKGRITSVTAVTITPAFSSLTGVPTTLAGHNITLTSGNVTTALGYTPVNPASAAITGGTIAGLTSLTVTGVVGMAAINSGANTRVDVFADGTGGIIQGSTSSGAGFNVLNVIGTTVNFKSSTTTIAVLNTSGFDVQSLLRCDSFRIDQTPTAATPVPTHTFTLNLNGTTYRVPCVV